jgi:hypothetical protein
MAQRPLTALAAGVASHGTVSMRVRRGRERRLGRGCACGCEGVGCPGSEELTSLDCSQSRRPP